MRFNANRKATRVRAFEVAKVFRRDASVADGPLSVRGLAQPLMVAGIAWGPALPEQWGERARAVDFFDVKADVEALFAPLGADAAPTFAVAAHAALHPGRAAARDRRGRVVGHVGELHPRWVQRYELPSAPMVFEIEAAALMDRTLPQPAPVPRVPMVVRDVALVVDAAMPAGRVAEAIDTARAAEGDLVRDVTLFDQYRGKGLSENEKSLAFRFRLQDTRHTLDDAAIEAAMTRMIAALGNSIGARQRQ